MLESASAATDLDLISYLRSIPDARMRRGVRFPAWYLLLVAVLGILSGCQSLRDLERFAIRHHAVLTEALGVEIRRPPSDSSFRYFFQRIRIDRAEPRSYPVVGLALCASDQRLMVDTSGRNSAFLLDSGS